MADELTPEERAAIEAFQGPVRRCRPHESGDRELFASGFTNRMPIMGLRSRRLAAAKRRLGLEPDEDIRSDIREQFIDDEWDANA